MRHAPLTLAQRASELQPEDRSFDIVFCTDMLALHEWRGLAPADLARLPTVIYFHENQYTYPIQPSAGVDLHYGFTNLLSAAAADAVWFNSRFHQQEFLSAAEQFLQRMPDPRHLDLVESVRAKSEVCPPGIEPVPPPESSADTVPTADKGIWPRSSHPLRIGWLARWEHDKGVDDFAAAIAQLSRSGAAFELVLLGQRYRKLPISMQRLLDQQRGRIHHAGYVESREQYRQCLRELDVAVSTARHEFFGIAMLEAASAGVLPVLPQRLAYPETFTHQQNAVFYDGSVAGLVQVLEQLCATGVENRLAQNAVKVAADYAWEKLGTLYDRQLEKIASKASRRSEPTTSGADKRR